MSECWGSLGNYLLCPSSYLPSPPSLPRDRCGPAVLTQSCQLGDKNYYYYYYYYYLLLTTFYFLLTTYFLLLTTYYFLPLLLLLLLLQ